MPKVVGYRNLAIMVEKVVGKKICGYLNQFFFSFMYEYLGGCFHVVTSQQSLFLPGIQ